jgi:hypothetical protein
MPNERLDERKPPVQEPPPDMEDDGKGKTIQAQEQSDTEPFEPSTVSADRGAPTHSVKKPKPKAADDPIGGEGAPSELQNLNSV